MQRILFPSQFVKERLIGELKEQDELFKILYSNIYHTGSFYDGLRITDALEFDLNVVLNIDVLARYIVFEDKKVDQGFINMALDRSPSMIIPQTHPLSKQVFILMRSRELHC